jgi:Phycobilisome degradation protein nblA
MNCESNQLSLEQEFMHEVFVAKVQNLSCEETKDLLVKFHKQMLFKDNFYKQLFRQQSKKTTNQLLEKNI